MITRIEMTNISVTSIRKYPKLLTPLSNSVSGALRLNLSDILPNSVLVPVLMTNTFAVPLTTKVPIKIEFVLSLSGVSLGNIFADFSTG